MLYRLLFNRFSDDKKKRQIQQHGTPIGTRFDSQRTLYLYIVKSLFVEVAYFEDNPDNSIEDIKIFNSHNALQDYLKGQN